MTIKHYTGQMTKEELKNTKIRIISDAHSKAFQEMCLKAGVVYKGCCSSYNSSQHLYIENDELAWGNSRDIFVSSANKEITWAPIDLSNALEDATHFDVDGVFFKIINSERWYYFGNSGWRSILYPPDDTLKISDFTQQQEEKQTTPNIIDKIRSVLPKDAEISIGHNHINLFIDDYCFKIENIEDINKIQSALNTIKEYQE